MRVLNGVSDILWCRVSCDCLLSTQDPSIPGTSSVTAKGAYVNVVALQLCAFVVRVGI